MASVNSVNSNTLNSLYGNRNVITGLASGMDTESMIENAVSGIKQKISSLYQKRTKVEWQQEALRSIIDKMANFSQKYTSYASSTNLLSASFFNNAMTAITNGKYADKVSASGRTHSDIRVLGVKQLATAATYTLDGLGGKTSSVPTVAASSGVDLSATNKVSTVSGTLTLGLGSIDNSVDIQFDSDKIFNSAEELAAEINNQLAGQNIKAGNEQKDAASVIKATVKDGTITFTAENAGGDTVGIVGATGKIKDTLGINTDTGSSIGDKPKTIEVGTTKMFDESKTLGENLSGKELTFTLDGKTKTIKTPEYTKEMSNDAYVAKLQEQLDQEFGKGAISVRNADASGGSLKLEFTAKENNGSTLKVTGDGMKSLGFSSNYATSYTDLGTTLGDILGTNKIHSYDMVEAVGKVREVKDSDGKITGYVDEKGNKVARNYDGKSDTYYQVDDQGAFLRDFKINGKSVGAFSENTAVESVLTAINNGGAGVKVSFSQTTNQFKFTATETGAAGRIEFGDGMAKDLFDPEPPEDTVINHNFADNYGFVLRDGEKDYITLDFDGFSLGFNVDNKMTMQDFAQKIDDLTGKNAYDVTYDEKTGQLSVIDTQTGQEKQFTIKDQYGFDYEREIEPVVNGKYTKGQDAILAMEVNGKTYGEISRSSNAFEVDGLTINLKDTFNSDQVQKNAKASDFEDAVSFTVKADTDKIVDTIKSWIDDYNEMISEIKSAYTTMPAQKTNGARYEPLTADQEAGLTETEIKNYEAKAKQGILFADRDLSSLYTKMTSALGGDAGALLRSIGIDTSYSNNLTTLTLDENKLRSVLESDPDKVKDAFTKSTSNGSSVNGVMQGLKNQLDAYAQTVGTKGILVTRAGSVKAPVTINSNSMQSILDNYDKQIERWEKKMSDQVDRYTSQFSKLEQLIAQMNSQSSTLMSLMGGNSSGY